MDEAAAPRPAAATRSAALFAAVILVSACGLAYELAAGALASYVLGDSITEQKLYSRFIEDYLVACLAELDLRTLQFG